jgi:hypothetical protein
MKRITSLFCLFCGLSTATVAQTETEEAVGINTENPRGVLHIDGAAKPGGINPQTGPVSAAQAADDVLIDAEGRLGVGVVVPMAKIDTQADIQGDALRIQDGTEGEGRILVSDATGATTWHTISTGVWWYAALSKSALLLATASTAGNRPYINYADSLVSSATLGSVNRTAGTITVPSAGKYRITASIHYGTERTTGLDPYYALSALLVNGVARWTPSVWGTQQGLGISSTYTAILDLQAGDVLGLALIQEQAFSANMGDAEVFMVELIQMQ